MLRVLVKYCSLSPQELFAVVRLRSIAIRATLAKTAENSTTWGRITAIFVMIVIGGICTIRSCKHLVDLLGLISVLIHPAGSDFYF